jgi:NDP-mannose synthase
MKVWYFLLAGGYGTRTKPLSLVKPKPAFPLGGTPLISIILEQLKSKGLNEGFINLHHLPETVKACIDKDKYPRAHFLFEAQLSGSQILKDALITMADDDLLLVLNGDIYLDLPYRQLKEQLIKSNADAVLLVRPRTQPEDMKYRSLIIKNSNFIHRGPLPEKTGYDSQVPEGYMYPGVALFTKKVIQTIDHISFFDSFAEQGFNIHVTPYDSIWLDIGDPASYMAADKAYKKHLGITIPQNNSISPNVTISPDSQVSNSIIWENTEILNGSVIDHCIITGDTRLENKKHKHSIIASSRSEPF